MGNYKNIFIYDPLPYDLNEIKIICNGRIVPENVYNVILEEETYNNLFSGLFTQNDINLFGSLFSTEKVIEQTRVKISFDLNKITFNKNDILYVDYYEEKTKRQDQIEKDPKYLYIEDNVESINEEDIIVIYNGRVLPKSHYSISSQEEYVRIELNPYKLPLSENDIVYIDYNKELV